jgi:hypothetical protein
MASGNSPSSKLLSGAMLATLIARLVPLFTGFASAEAARDAALAALLAYGPETEAEFALAAEIISFSLHSLDALARAIGPDVSLNQTLRLRGSAVSLSREAHKAQRKLDQMQKARRQGAPVTAAAETVLVEAQPPPARQDAFPPSGEGSDLRRHPATASRPRRAVAQRRCPADLKCAGTLRHGTRLTKLRRRWSIRAEWLHRR